MSLKDLVEAECGQANSLINLGSHVNRDLAFRDEGISGAAGPSYGPQRRLDENQMVNEFLGQIAPAPQSFRMDVLLQEMREIDGNNFQRQVIPAKSVREEIHSGAHWANEFANKPAHFNHREQLMQDEQFSQAWLNSPNIDLSSLPLNRTQENMIWTREFFEQNESKEAGANEIQQAATEVVNAADPEQLKYSEFMKFMLNVSDGKVKVDDGQVITNNDLWSEQFLDTEKKNNENLNAEDWVKTFEENKQHEMEQTDNYNKQFWDRLQNEWKRISDENGPSQHPWLSEYSDYYDPYKEYKFDEENPMINIDNAFEKGKEFLAKDDIPSAVLCFESAVQQNPENGEIWELLGISQAENEKDPNAIAALKKALDLNPNNMKVLMALAVSYTNESLQSRALQMLVRWLKCNPKYGHLVSPNMMPAEEENAMASSIIRGPELKEVQNVLLAAVQQNPDVVDADIQEALGVLFNLSSEYDKAVDCFQAALLVRPDSAKTWNKMGASLANGSRAIEAVDAYQRALAIQPGFVRARYNVGIICINLKAYREAGEHLLTALNLQASSIARAGVKTAATANTQMSETIWSTLRMVISLMGRSDLHGAIDNKDLESLNKSFITE